MKDKGKILDKVVKVLTVMLKNSKEGLMMTLFGVLLILAGIATIIFDHLALEGSIAIITLGLGAIGAPDNPKGPSKKVVVWLILGVALLTNSGCVTYKKCLIKFGEKQDTVYVTQMVPIEIIKEVPVAIPADSLITRISLDKLLLSPVQDTVVIVSDDGRAQVTFWKDRYNNYLNTRVDCLPDTILKIVTVRDTVAVEVACPPVTVFEDKPGWFKVAMTNLGYLVLILLAFYAIITKGRFGIPDIFKDKFPKKS